LRQREPRRHRRRRRSSRAARSPRGAAHDARVDSYAGRHGRARPEHSRPRATPRHAAQRRADSMKRLKALLVALALAGCVFRQTDVPRYFRPDSKGLSPEPTLQDAAPARTIRLRAVRARPLLRERIVWRTSTEYGMYEQRRWSDLPEAYVEQAIASALR